jgi:The ARF-like 2 binding protein BART
MIVAASSCPEVPLAGQHDSQSAATLQLGEIRGVPSTMDKFCIHALESLLRGSEWDEDFRSFSLTLCPRFRSFTKSRDICDDSGYDILMFDAYNDFRTFFDSKLQIYFAEMGITFDTFSKSLTLQVVNESSVALKLQSHLEMYCDFEKFCLIMQSKFEESFPVKSPNSLKRDEPSSKVISIQSHNLPITVHEDVRVQNDQCSDQNVLPIRSKAVRVLWDIENVPVSKNLGGLNALSKLNR